MHTLSLRLIDFINVKKVKLKYKTLFFRRVQSKSKMWTAQRPELESPHSSTSAAYIAIIPTWRCRRQDVLELLVVCSRHLCETS